MMISSHDEIKSLGRFSPDKPIKILVSACLLGDKCGVDGNAYGHFLHVENIVKRPVDVVILTDFSAACGPQVIFDGIRNKKNLKYQKGPDD